MRLTTGELHGANTNMFSFSLNPVKRKSEKLAKKYQNLLRLYDSFPEQPGLELTECQLSVIKFAVFHAASQLIRYTDYARLGLNADSASLKVMGIDRTYNWFMDRANCEEKAVDVERKILITSAARIFSYYKGCWDDLDERIRETERAEAEFEELSKNFDGLYDGPFTRPDGTQYFFCKTIFASYMRARNRRAKLSTSLPLR